MIIEARATEEELTVTVIDSEVTTEEELRATAFDSDVTTGGTKGD